MASAHDGLTLTPDLEVSGEGQGNYPCDAAVNVVMIGKSAR
jgi:hypothetical protein